MALFNAVIARALLDIINYNGIYHKQAQTHEEQRKHYASQIARHHYTQSKLFFRKNGGYDQWLKILNIYTHIPYEQRRLKAMRLIRKTEANFKS